MLSSAKRALTIIALIFTVCYCQICSDGDTLSLTDKGTVIFEVDKTNRTTTTLNLTTTKLNADHCQCGGVNVVTKLAELGKDVEALRSLESPLSMIVTEKRNTE
jgi:hypothetical protein